MGVKGLWKLLLPIGRRISIETLAGKTLAIDASIWLTQFLKAMRDPETGKLVRSAHLIGFFRRICRLKFHRIRPVFVFDGATPEIKRAEVLRRKRKRDTFADSLDQQSMQRLAKKLLTERLRKVKAIKSGKTITDEGGFEAGFNPGGSQWSKSNDAPSSSHDVDQDTQDNAKESKNSAQVGSQTQENCIDLLDSSDEVNIDTEATSKEPISDWDLPVSSDLNTKGNQNEEVTTHHATVFTAEGSLAVDLVSSMSTDAERKDAVEQARKNQRMRSRQEFMPAAANPQDFSSVQMRNFLKYCKLNKDIATMAKKVADRRSQHGGPIAAKPPQTSRVEFIQHEETESEHEHEIEESDSVASESLEPVKRGWKVSPLESHCLRSTAEKEESSEDGGCSVVQIPARAKRRAILDSSDDDESTKGNQSSGLAARANSMTSNKALPEARTHNDHSQGGFILSTSETQQATQPTNASVPNSVSNDFALAKLLQENEDSAFANALNEEIMEQGRIASSPECTSPTQDMGTANCPVDSSKYDSEESVDDIDWEDGAAPKVEQSESHNANSTEVQMDGNHLQRSFSGGVGIDKAFSEQTDRDPGHASWPEFGESYRSHGTAEALKQAEATASNLANWAGRAFRRALKEVHQPIESQTPSTEHGKTNNLQVDTDEDTDVNEYDTTELIEPDTGRNNEPTQDDLSAERTQGSTPVEPTENLHQRKRPENETAASAHRTSSDAGRNRMDLFDWSSIRKQQERETDTISDEMLEESKLLLQLFGIPYVEAPAEAEAQCVALEKLGIVDGVVTEDSDAFVFGAQRVYKHIFDEQKYAEAYISADAEKEMNLNKKSMVALALLLGGDYTEGVKGVGIVNAMEVLEAFNVSENAEQGLIAFKNWMDGFDPFIGRSKPSGATGPEIDRRQERFHEQHKSARSRWIPPGNFPSKEVLNAYLNPVVDQSAEDFTWGIVDEVNLVKFCEAYLHWEPDYTLQQLKPVLEAQTAGLHQRRIDSYMRYEDSIKFGEINSKRLQKVLKRKTQERREPIVNREIEDESLAALKSGRI